MSDSLLQEVETRTRKLSKQDSTELITQYAALRQYEGDYDKAQGILRTIASAWLLAAIGAIGLIVQSEFSVQTPALWQVAGSLRQAVLLFTAFGIASLWYLDQGVYQRLLHAVFALGCHIELASDRIVPLRSYMYSLNLDVTRRLGRFYFVPFVALLVAGAANLLNAFAHVPTLARLSAGVHFKHAPDRWQCAILGAGHLVLAIMVLQRSNRWPTLADRLPVSLRQIRGTERQAPSVPSSQRRGHRGAQNDLA